MAAGNWICNCDLDSDADNLIPIQSEENEGDWQYKKRYAKDRVKN